VAALLMMEVVAVQTAMVVAAVTQRKAHCRAARKPSRSFPGQKNPILQPSGAFRRSSNNPAHRQDKFACKRDNVSFSSHFLK
jgi:hypothetical protein